MGTINASVFYHVTSSGAEFYINTYYVGIEGCRVTNGA